MVNRKSIRFALGAGGALVCVAFATVASMAQSPPPPPNLDNITVGPRFSPNPIEIRSTAGGTIAVKEIVGKTSTPTGPCTGFANSKPNHVLVLTTFFKSLSVLVDSPEDTALAIQGPGGVWCNDDYIGKNPGISGQWLPGTYNIWVGPYAKDRQPSYVLRITEERRE
jgi:hypothetical protein